MEEVVGSIPTRSTIFSITYNFADQSVGSIWQQIAKTFSICSQGFRLHPQFLMNRVDGRTHALGNLLHVHIGRCGRTRMPQEPLNIFHCSFLLSERCNRSAHDLERE